EVELLRLAATLAPIEEIRRLEARLQDIRRARKVLEILEQVLGRLAVILVGEVEARERLVGVGRGLRVGPDAKDLGESDRRRVLASAPRLHTFELAAGAVLDILEGEVRVAASDLLDPIAHVSLRGHVERAVGRVVDPREVVLERPVIGLESAFPVADRLEVPAQLDRGAGLPRRSKLEERSQVEEARAKRWSGGAGHELEQLRDLEMEAVELGVRLRPSGPRKQPVLDRL